MIATCSFCREILSASEMVRIPRDEMDALAIAQHNFQQLAALVSAHMSGAHENESVAGEILGAMVLAGSAVAMRYVMIADHRVENLRLAAESHLAAAFNPAPVGPVPSLAG